MAHQKSSSPFADPSPSTSTPDTTAPPAYTPTNLTPSYQPASQSPTSHPPFHSEKQQLHLTQTQPIHIDTSLSPLQPPIPHPPSSSPLISSTTSSLQIPSTKRLPTSGFPYPSLLSSAGISATTWQTFTSSINAIAQMRAGGWTLTIGATSLTAAMLNIFLTPLIGVPVGVAIFRKLHRAQEFRNLERGRENGVLEMLIERWNRDVFLERGLLVTLDIRGENEGVAVGAVRALRERGGGGGEGEGGEVLGASEDGVAERRAKKARRSQRKVYDRARITITPVARPISGDAE
ncbi:MAG: hypothetical protein M1836_002022 [Candelina mexicana]|nr:MAG: hypothetical protein M1836_002022 [Candelina mexicana]